MKMAGSARTTLLLSKIVPAYAGPPERYFRSKELSEMGFGRPLGPPWEMGAPQPSPNQSLLSRMAGFVSVLRVTDDCDERRSGGRLQRAILRALINLIRLVTGDGPTNQLHCHVT